MNIYIERDRRTSRFHYWRRPVGGYDRIYIQSSGVQFAFSIHYDVRLFVFSLERLIRAYGVEPSLRVIRRPGLYVQYTADRESFTSSIASTTHWLGCATVLQYTCGGSERSHRDLASALR